MEDNYEVRTDKAGTHYYKNNLLHREDGPAIIGSTCTKEWFINGKRHRDDGPAVESLLGTKEWWFDDKRHREDGPSVIWHDGEKEWYVNHIVITKEVEEWITSNNIPDHKEWSNKEIALFKLKFL